MEIKEEIIEEVLVCSISGEINLDTSPHLRKLFDKAMHNKRKRVLVDFSGVTYIDSSGLATLIEMMQKVNKIGGQMRLSNLSDKVRNIFEITKLDKLFQIYPDRHKALENFIG